MASAAEALIRLRLQGQQAVKSGLDDTASSADRLKGSLKALGAAGGALAAAGVSAGFLQGLDVEEANDKLAAQLDLTGPESKKMGRIAGKLWGDAYGESLEEVNTSIASVMTSIRRLRGGSDNEIRGAAATALDFAKTFDTDLSEGVGAVGFMLNNKLAKNTTQAFDLMTKASSKTAPAMRDNLVGAVSEFGQDFASLGFSGQQMFAILAKGSEKGSEGLQRAGDAMKELVIRGSDMSTASTDAYTAMGLDAEDMARKLAAGGKGSQAATQQIIKGLLAIDDPAKRANSAIALFGSPLEDLNVTQIPEFLKSLRSGSKGLQGFEGAAQRMSDNLNDNTKTSIEMYKRRGLQALTSVTENQVIPALLATYHAGRKAYEWLSGASTGAKLLTTTLVAGTAAFVAYKLATMAMLAPLALVLVATRAWTAAQLALNFSIAANPIGLVIAAIAALAAGVYLAYQRFEGFRKVVDATFAFVRDNWRWLLIPVAPIVAPILFIQRRLGGLVSFITGMPAKISGAAKGMFRGIGEAFRSAINWIIRAWNGLKFTIPSVGIPGLGKIGGKTIGVPPITELASGGFIQRGGMAVVGERGPELVRLPSRSTVYDAQQSAAALGGAGRSTTIHTHVHLNDREIARAITEVEATDEMLA